jgi:hypothetical protein
VIIGAVLHSDIARCGKGFSARVRPLVVVRVGNWTLDVLDRGDGIIILRVDCVIFEQLVDKVCSQLWSN